MVSYYNLFSSMASEVSGYERDVSGAGDSDRPPGQRGVLGEVEDRGGGVGAGVRRSLAEMICSIRASSACLVGKRRWSRR